MINLPESLRQLARYGIERPDVLPLFLSDPSTLNLLYSTCNKSCHGRVPSESLFISTLQNSSSFTIRASASPLSVPWAKVCLQYSLFSLPRKGTRREPLWVCLSPRPYCPFPPLPKTIREEVEEGGKGTWEGQRERSRVPLSSIHRRLSVTLENGPFYTRH